MIICSASGENVISVFPVFFPFSLMKCLHRAGYIVSPLSEARQLQFEHVEAVEQIFSKQPVIDEFLQVLVRCRDDADVDRDDPVMTDTHDLPLLKNPEESALQLRSDIADLIEENCPIVSELEQSSLTPFTAPVKAPSTYPNSSLSSRSSERAAQLMAMKGWAWRAEELWMLCANSSLPVPVSP